MGTSKRAFRAAWSDLCRTEGYQGNWVALDNVRYAKGSSEVQEADVVDADADLCSLIERMRMQARTSCCILKCSREARTRP